MERERLYGGREDRIVQDSTRPPHHGGHGQQLECFSDEVSSHDGEERRDDGSVPPATSGGGDAASVETGKRRRGRPPGSKNKPKPPPVITRDVEPAAAMRPHVFEIPGGGDVAAALAGFARRRGLGICVLAGTGAVADVSLRHPSPVAADGRAAAVILRGRYEILSISATFLPPSMAAAVPRAVRDLSVSLAGPHGQIVGGAVAGPLIAATTVVVLAAAFTDLTFHRLPLEDDESASVSGSGDADEHRGHQKDPQDASGLHPHPHSIAPATEPVPLYPRQPQEAWAPAASTQRPRPPYHQ
ncbi:AT-hook motif nuclear-localized protein 28-like [Phragmites australis]|uniref:AT-hook motif nuclear-localized protein 28-like n=1 Tax=Phragmites australis TaxID=29695 RepID=UPI002D780D97|nr:AT-hook motif nuclear-localized protein 28-like [Phragmites australis]